MEKIYSWNERCSAVKVLTREDCLKFFSQAIALTMHTANSFSAFGFSNTCVLRLLHGAP